MERTSAAPPPTLDSTETWEALGHHRRAPLTAVAASPGARAAVELELAAIDAAASRFRADSEL